MTGPLRAIYRDPTLRLCALAIVMVGATSATLGPYQSLLAIKIFGLSETAYSGVLALGSVASVVAALGIGILTDQRANRRRMAILAAGLMLAGLVLVRAGMTPWAFVLAHGLILPIASTLYGQVFALARLATAQMEAPDRDPILAALRAIFAAPFVVVLPLWSVAFGAGADLLDIYLPTLGLAAVTLLLLWRSWPIDGGTEWSDRRSGLSALGALREVLNPAIALRIVLLGAIGFGPLLHMVLVGLIFADIPGRGASATALFTGLVAGLEVPVMLGMGLMTRRIGRVPLMAAGAVIYAAYLLVLAPLAPSPMAWALILPAAFGGAILLSLPIAYMQDLMAARPGMGGALLAVQKVVGDGFAALAFAFGTALGGYWLAGIIGAALMLVAAVLLLWVDRRR